MSTEGVGAQDNGGRAAALGALDNPPYGRYLVWVLGTVGVCFLPLVVSIAFLYQSRELISLREAASLQQRSEALLGLASYENFFKYKLAIVRERRPTVMALGSSRVMQFREESFAVPFANAGGAMTSLERGEMFLENVDLAAQPSVLIVGLDFWWFFEGWPDYLSVSPDDADQLSAFRVRQPQVWLSERRISPQRFGRVLLFGDRSNPFTTYPGIGIMAIESASGFRRDGSYHYGNHYFGTYDRLDVRFGITLSRVASVDAIFPKAQPVGEGKLAALNRFLEWIGQHRMRAVLVLPPLAPEVLTRLSANEEQRRALDQVIAIVRERVRPFANVELYDFTAGPPGQQSCEYVDGIHGGDVTFQRMLLEIAAENPRSALQGLLQRDSVRETIGRFAGHALSITDAGRYKAGEVDFLQLGCRK